MVKDKKTLKLDSLNMDELVGVINIYPWFAAARMELCRRMADLGNGAWSDERFAREALYIGSRKLVARLVRDKNETDFSDSQIGELLNSYFSNEGKKEDLKKVVVVGGDYFSQADYDKVRREDDNYFAGFCPSDDGKSPVQTICPAEEFTDFCTESLAQVYLDQGFPEAARNIYSQLSLRYPEKSVYFATLIEKIDNKI